MTEQTIELTIDSLAAGGDGVGRDEDSRVTFVPHTAPGDRVRVCITQAKKSFARGSVVEVLEASAQRAEPECAYFRDNTCGGCQWQHLAYDAQLAAKRDIVAGALRKAVARGLDIAPVQPLPEPYGWRRRARLHWVRRKRDKRALVGFHAPRTKRVSDIERCVQLEPGLQSALDAVRQSLAPELTGSGELHLVIGHNGGVHLVVRGPCAPKAVAAMVGQGGIVGAALGRNRFGEASIELEPGLMIRADEFAQASRVGNGLLVAAVSEACGAIAGKNVLELFAGSGNFTRLFSAADSGARVVAIDTHALPQLEPPHRTIRGAAGEITSGLARKSETFDIVLLDPPRTGAREAIPAIAAVEPARIVYVSCDPATLGRDLDTLADLGYRAEHAQPIDLMPQTAHVEVVVRLSVRV